MRMLTQMPTVQMHHVALWAGNASAPRTARTAGGRNAAQNAGRSAAHPSAQPWQRQRFTERASISTSAEPAPLPRRPPPRLPPASSFSPNAAPRRENSFSFPAGPGLMAHPQMSQQQMRPPAASWQRAPPGGNHGVHAGQATAMPPSAGASAYGHAPIYSVEMSGVGCYTATLEQRTRGHETVFLHIETALRLDLAL